MTLAKARASGAVVEALEGRRLLTAVADEVAAPTEWEFIGDRGEHRGTATLVDGILHIVGTDGGEQIQIGTGSDHDVIGVVVTDNSGVSLDYTRVRGVNVERSRVRGIQVDAGDGNDWVAFLNSNGLVNLPVTINGGAGDDGLYGEDDRNNLDDPTASREHQSSYAKVVLNGGDGNDRLQAWIGDTTLIGGAGDDQIDTLGSWGHNMVIDDPPQPPPAPAEDSVQANVPQAASPSAATEDGASESATNPTAVPPPFSTVAVSSASSAVLGDHADDLWDA